MRTRVNVYSIHRAIDSVTGRAIVKATGHIIKDITIEWEHSFGETPGLDDILFLDLEVRES